MSRGPARATPCFSALLRAQRAGLLALLPLLVWALVWGSWHRTSHGLPRLSAAAAWVQASSSVSPTVLAQPDGAAVVAIRVGHSPAAGPLASSDAGHGAGSADCRLLDQLLLADVLSALPSELLLQPEPTALPVHPEAVEPSAASRWSRQARAPPLA